MPFRVETAFSERIVWPDSFWPSGSILLIAMYDMDGALYSYILRYSLVLARFWDFFNFFMKKDVKIFAGSKNVVTFASAFEKTRFLQRLKVCNRGVRNPWVNGENSENATFLKKNICRIEKDDISLQSFRIAKCGFFTGSLNYWLFLREIEM